MKLVITEKQLELLLSKYVKDELDEQDAAPTTGTSDKQTGGQGYPEVTKWESGVDRSGPGNQVGVTKWSDIVGSKLTRGKANPLNEQTPTNVGNKVNVKSPIQGDINKELSQVRNTFNSLPKTNRPGSDFFSNFSSNQRQDIKKNIENSIQKKYFPIQRTKRIYTSDDPKAKGFFLDIADGNFPQALLEAREFTFSMGGLITQVVLGTLSAAVIGPGGIIAIEAFNTSLFINDIYIWNYNNEISPKIPPKNLSPFECIKWLFNNDESFKRIIEDLFILAIGGVIKGVSGAWKWLLSLENNIGSIINLCNKFVNEIVGKIGGKLGEYLSSKFSFVKKFTSFLEKNESKNSISSTIIKGVSRLPLTITKALGIVYGVTFGINMTSKLLNISRNETIMLVNGQKVDQKIHDKLNDLTPNNVKDEIEKQTNEESKQQFKQNISTQASMQLKLIKIIKNNISLYEDKEYAAIIQNYGNVCERNKFKHTDYKTYSGEEIFIINNEYYFIDNDGQLKQINYNEIKKNE